MYLVLVTLAVNTKYSTMWVIFFYSCFHFCHYCMPFRSLQRIYLTFQSSQNPESVEQLLAVLLTYCRACFSIGLSSQWYFGKNIHMWPFLSSSMFFCVLKSEYVFSFALIFSAFIPLVSTPRSCNTIFIPFRLGKHIVHFLPINHPSKLAVSLPTWVHIHITSIESVVCEFLMARCIIK